MTKVAREGEDTEEKGNKEEEGTMAKEGKADKEEEDTVTEEALIKEDHIIGTRTIIGPKDTEATEEEGIDLILLSYANLLSVFGNCTFMYLHCA